MATWPIIRPDRTGIWPFRDGELMEEQRAAARAVAVPRCERPTKPGLYICVLRGHRPEMAEIRAGLDCPEELEFLCGLSVYPLDMLEASAKFYGPIHLEGTDDA